MKIRKISFFAILRKFICILDVGLKAMILNRDYFYTVYGFKS